jgi:hypothetical protein
MSTAREPFRYCPYYCEENIWHLCREPQFAGREAQVVFISNPTRTCALWGQRAAHDPAEPVVWDYHVILAVRDEAWMIWDLDTILGLPLEAGDYLQRTFRPHHPIAKQFRPQFRFLGASWFAEHFASDRSHMKDQEGRWLEPPPAWPMILPGQSNLTTLFDFRDKTQPQPLSLDEATACFATRK